jgi:hypothetical protein
MDKTITTSNYYFCCKYISKQILDKLEELTLRIERLEISEGLSIADNDTIAAIPFTNDRHTPYI